jgi:hypothetical protein
MTFLKVFGGCLIVFCIIEIFFLIFGSGIIIKLAGIKDKNQMFDILLCIFSGICGIYVFCL